MPKKRYTAEQIIRHLREAAVALAKGQTTGGGLSEVRNHGATILSMAGWIEALTLPDSRVTSCDHCITNPNKDRHAAVSEKRPA